MVRAVGVVGVVGAVGVGWWGWGGGGGGGGGRGGRWREGVGAGETIRTVSASSGQATVGTWLAKTSPGILVDLFKLPLSFQVGPSDGWK